MMMRVALGFGIWVLGFSAGLTAQAPRVVDLGHPLAAGDPSWSGKPAFERKGTPRNGSFSSEEHFGTHLDAPSHFGGAWTTDKIPADRLVRPGVTINVTGKPEDYQVTLADVKAFESRNGPIEDGTIVLVATGWDARWKDRRAYMNERNGVKHFPGIGTEAATYLARDRKVAGIGIDTPSVDYGPSEKYETHNITMPLNVYHVENAANLTRLPPRGFTVVVAPINLAGGSGGPTRMFALLSDVGGQEWDPKAAAAHLDARQEWWSGWKSAARDHGTFCVSCHTALPYALARPSLRAALGESRPSAVEQRLVDNVSKRVRMWRDVAPFYSDQRVGLPKTSESRGTEAVLNALILATRDAETGAASDEGRQALAHLWDLQMKSGDLAGAWAWLNFKYEPWESGDGPYYGAALAAIAVGTAPGDHVSHPELQNNLKLLRAYLARGAASQNLFNRVMGLWASSRLAGVLTSDEQQKIVADAFARQQEDGGWTLSSLGSWKRMDGTPLDTRSDGYATGLITLVLQEAGIPFSDARLQKARAWLVDHQDRTTGAWPAYSLNKQRDPASDAAQFMSDAATAYAVAALCRDGRAQRSSRSARSPDRDGQLYARGGTRTPR
jgi:squalene-hopene/tetraprenyl-beta-curcumene cyclase